jgi:acetyl esterase/lipase
MWSKVTRDIEPRWLLPVQDTQRALSLARSRVTQWGLDPQRLGVLGFSAGGNAAGMAAIKDGERQYPAADDADKLSCRADFAVLIYPGGFLDEQQQLRPEVQITKQMPPVFMAQAFDDQGPAQNCVALAGALRSVGVPCELHLYDRGGHGFGLRSQPDFPVTTWPSRCAEWLRVRGLLMGSDPGHPDR